MSTDHQANSVEMPFNLSEMTREELDTLLQGIESELEARAFEDHLRREVQSHLQKQAWIESHHASQRRRRRR